MSVCALYSNFVACIAERAPRLSTGIYDWVCNFKGNERWVHALEWTGNNAFNSTEYRRWSVEGTVAGDVKSAKGLTFATVFGAGHMVRNLGIWLLSIDRSVDEPSWAFRSPTISLFKL